MAKDLKKKGAALPVTPVMALSPLPEGVLAADEADGAGELKTVEIGGDADVGTGGGENAGENEDAEASGESEDAGRPGDVEESGEDEDAEKPPEENPGVLILEKAPRIPAALPAAEEFGDLTITDTYEDAPLTDEEWSGYYRSICTNEIWCADNHVFDLRVKDEKGRVFRRGLSAGRINAPGALSVIS